MLSTIEGIFCLRGVNSNVTHMKLLMVQENKTPLKGTSIRLLVKEKADGLSVYCICPMDRQKWGSILVTPRPLPAPSSSPKPYR